ncbi:MAG: helix-turn-helix domain-containing protein [Proteobacteria bacterium]|nr:helix-turn-helix domain-containing protein [Pseudomonadota bacterium]
MNSQKQVCMSPQQVSDAYGLPKGTLANMRWARKGPRFYKQNRKILYKVADLEAWLYQNPVMTIDAHLDR